MKKVIWIFLAAILFTACEESNNLEIYDVFVSKDYISVASNLSLLGDGQEAELEITANCNWSISSIASWLSVTPSSGSNSETVVISAEKNTTGQQRSATLTIRAGSAPTKSVVITQGKGTEEPVIKTMSTNLSLMSFEATEDSKTFTISSNTSWTISKPDWCTLSVSSGKGNADVIVTASENPSKEQRSGQIVISGEEVNSLIINVSQKGKDVTNTQEPGSGDNQPPTW